MEFSGRCKGLAQRIMSKVNEPVAQRIHRENADRMCLARVWPVNPELLVVMYVMPILGAYKKL